MTSPRLAPTQSGFMQSGFMQIDALMAILTLGGTAVLCLHLAWQSVLSQSLQQQWLDAIEPVDGAITAVHVWPQSLSHWQAPTPSITLSSTLGSLDPKACSQSSCSLPDWSSALAQWHLSQLPQLLPQSVSQWLPAQTLSWQAGPSALSLPLHTWQLSWGSDNPQRLQLHLTP